MASREEYQKAIQSVNAGKATPREMAMVKTAAETPNYVDRKAAQDALNGRGK